MPGGRIAALGATLDLHHGLLGADPLKCDLAQYKGSPGLTAAVEQDLLVVSWAGQGGAELRARFAIDGAQPIIRDLAIRKPGGQWAILGQNLSPEYHVTTGVRRMTEQQAQPLRALGIEITPEIIEKNKWYAFWDSPLFVPPSPDAAAQGQRGQEAGRGRGQGAPPTARVLGPPRTPAEIRRAMASFNTTSCSVKTDGARIEVTFPGLSMGLFAGNLRFTVYRGANLFRMDAVAKTDAPSVAYKYEAGLKGFTTDLTPRVTWHDTGGHPQQSRFGGTKNDGIVPVKAANRVVVAEGKGGSLATFPPPHTFFFSREVDTNLGYVWYRKDADTRFAIGIRQGDGEEVEQYRENFALYNAPPGTWQRMAVYFYAGAEAAEPTRRAALAFTHGDGFKALPGYKTMVNHFHLRFTERQRATGSLDAQFQDLVAMKALGINIVGLSDFHGDMHPNDPGPLRFKDWKDYGEASTKASDKDFLVTPWEEPTAYFGGHYNSMFPKNVYWSKVRQPGQPFTEDDPAYGKVYHTGSAADMQQLLDAENGYWYHSHPRTKGTTGYPDAIFDKAYVKNDRYLGIAFKPGMGMDLSAQRLCEWRCFDALDTMNNLFVNTGLRPKYLIADVDTYRKGPEDDLYPNFPITYLKLDRVPGPEDDWSPILKALRNGDFFVTTGEILIKSYGVEGSGNQRTIMADVEWTFPLEFVEVVWGDGKKVDRQIIPATDLPPFGTKRFAIPFDARGKSWVRVAVWDSAGNGGFVQPVWVQARTTSTAAGRSR
ncbi:MAG: hypothetical protein HYZ58_15820 [Acidobacteria bacterium]|nr:hypothetical protein [Acidobacteriota bacterium]